MYDYAYTTATQKTSRFTSPSPRLTSPSTLLKVYFNPYLVNCSCINPNTKTTKMSIQRDLSELLNAGVISPETADEIRDYYRNKGGEFSSRLFIVFGILGAILVGLGIILIIAHNWDELSRSVKTGFAFMPLLVGQGLCGFTLLRQRESVAWRESTSVFLFFAVGASISLISQIYNIPGDISSFVLTWMLLCLPLVYIMPSSVVSLFYLVGITYYACETGYWSYPRSESYWYWGLLLLILPHYYLLYRNRPASNFMIFHHWLVPLSVLIVLGTVAHGKGELMFIAYFSLFGLFYLLGNTSFFDGQHTRNNGYKILGSLGTIILLLVVSFDWFWQDLRADENLWNGVLMAPEFWVSLLLSLLGGGLLFLQQKGKSLQTIKPISVVFLLFILIFLLGLVSSFAVGLINLVVLAIGVLTIREGAQRDHLGILNYGLLIITALILCRFFDGDLSFVIRGLLFVLVGAGFFATNYWMLKKRGSLTNQ